MPTRRRPAARAPVGAGLRAGAAAALPSGLPSSVHAFWTARDLLGTARAAGGLLVPRAGDVGLVAAAVVVHGALSLAWGAAVAVALDRLRVAPGLLVGAAAGVAIAALDLGVVARLPSPRVRRVRELPQLPQLLDHLAFGVLVGRSLVRQADARV